LYYSNIYVPETDEYERQESTQNLSSLTQIVSLTDNLNFHYLFPIVTILTIYQD
jgi:hypothetical protein